MCIECKGKINPSNKQKLKSRHCRKINQKIHKHNTILRRKHHHMFWSHGDFACKEAISKKDHTHFRDEFQDIFEDSIAMALTG